MKDAPTRYTNLGEGGFGDEARITLEFRKEFPGIGGEIITSEGVATALRAEHNCFPKIGHRMFLKHMVIKKMEDYFHRSDLYQVPHIPRPLGSISRSDGQCYEACIYEWDFGSEGFPWSRLDPEIGNVPIALGEWNVFVGAFYSAGIDLKSDCTPPEGETSKNVIHEYYRHIDLWDPEGLNFLWKRIDFGEKSMRMDYEKLSHFLEEREEDIKDKLRVDRYNMIRFACDYLIKGPEQMDRLRLGRLIELVRDYRVSSLRHLISRGVGKDEATVSLSDKEVESLV